MKNVEQPEEITVFSQQQSSLCLRNKAMNQSQLCRFIYNLIFLSKTTKVFENQNKVRHMNNITTTLPTLNQDDAFKEGLILTPFTNWFKKKRNQFDFPLPEKELKAKTLQKLMYLYSKCLISFCNTQNLWEQITFQGDGLVKHIVT